MREGSWRSRDDVRWQQSGRLCLFGKAVVDLARRFEAPIARQAANRETWFRHHRIVPARLGDGFEVLAKPSSGRTDERLRAIRKDRHADVKIMVGHFEDGVTVDLTPRPNGRMLVRGVTDTDRRWGSIEALLDEAKDCGAHVLVLPELTVSAKLRDRVAEWMIENKEDHSMALALPGSAHEQEDGETYNRAVLLDAAGREAASHRKLRIFGDAPMSIGSWWSSQGAVRWSRRRCADSSISPSPASHSC